MEKDQLVIGLDIGTTKISAIVGRMTEHHKIEVLGMGKAVSSGVMRGVVANITETINAIRAAVTEAENHAGTNITEVYVGIAGQHIRSLQHRGILTREDSDVEITRADINRLRDDMYRLSLNPGEKVIHVLPQEFIVDNEQGILNPVGMDGSRLEANFHIIVGQNNAIRNIYRCVEKAGLIVKGLVLEPLASADSVLTNDEKEAGVALVDIGGGTTDIAIFQDGLIRHTAVIPFGGNVISRDIKEGLFLMTQQAELLKVKFGSALPMESQQNEIISVAALTGRQPKEISMFNLAHIINARMKEIMEHVDFQIQSSGFGDRLIGGIVMTGGGSQLSHCKQLVEYCTGLEARIGAPVAHLAKTDIEEVKNPMYATGLGLIIKGFSDIGENINQPEMANNEEGAKRKSDGIIDWIGNWIKRGGDFITENDEDLN